MLILTCKWPKLSSQACIYNHWKWLFSSAWIMLTPSSTHTYESRGRTPQCSCFTFTPKAQQQVSMHAKDSFFIMPWRHTQDDMCVSESSLGSTPWETAGTHANETVDGVHIRIQQGEKNDPVRLSCSESSSNVCLSTAEHWSYKFSLYNHQA